MMSSNENLRPTVQRRVMREIRALHKDPVEGISLHIEEGNISEIHADINGPEGTPFEGSMFRIRLVLGPDFPNSPPKGYFVTKIFHPNVSEAGEICVNTLKRDWSPEHGIKHILMIIRCLLIHPNPTSSLNEEAGRLLLEDYSAFARRAKMFTSIHATKIPVKKPEPAESMTPPKLETVEESSSSAERHSSIQATSSDRPPKPEKPTKKALKGPVDSSSPSSGVVLQKKIKAKKRKPHLKKKKSIKRL